MARTDRGGSLEEGTHDIANATRRPRSRGLALGEGSLIGLTLGIVDIHLDRFPTEVETYIAAGIILGLRHGRRAWAAWVPLGGGLYLVHVAAIAHGLEPPYVEAGYESAFWCLDDLVPAALGLGAGAGIRPVLTRISLLIRCRA